MHYQVFNFQLFPSFVISNKCLCYVTIYLFIGMFIQKDNQITYMHYIIDAYEPLMH
jgi:hypothetical protein